jgi:hypothetical protein
LSIELEYEQALEPQVSPDLVRAKVRIEAAAPGLTV